MYTGRRRSGAAVTLMGAVIIVLAMQCELAVVQAAGVPNPKDVVVSTEIRYREHDPERAERIKLAYQSQFDHDLDDVHTMTVVLFFIFVLLAACTVMNMLTFHVMATRRFKIEPARRETLLASRLLLLWTASLNKIYEQTTAQLGW